MAIKYNGQDLAKRYINGREVEKVMKNGVQIWPAAQPVDNYLCFTANESGAEVNLHKYGAPYEVELEVSTDGQTWRDYYINSAIRLNNIGDKVYFRNKSETVTGFNKRGNDNHYEFAFYKSVGASGDINYLLCKHSTLILDEHLHEFCFHDLFYYCPSLTTAPELPAVILAPNCYEDMFEYCSSLTVAPELPATGLAFGCYQGMFRGCSSLTAAPELPATMLTDACYSNMFGRCTLLRTPPSLHATYITRSSYSSMFVDCTSLESLPMLPATTLGSSCYQGMFRNCTNIKISETQTSECNIPYKIPAFDTGTGGQDSLTNMFAGTGGPFTGTPNINQTYYTNNTPIAPVSTDYLCFIANETNSSICLYQHGQPMFNSFEISTDKQTWSRYPAYGTDIVLANVGDRVYFRNTMAGPPRRFSYDSEDCWRFRMSGSILARGNINSLLGYDFPNTHPSDCFWTLFKDCTSLITPPELPAMTVNEAAYANMFEGCTSLIMLPKLPATRLEWLAYYGMFKGCINIRISEYATFEHLNGYRIPSLGEGTSGANPTLYMFADTGGTFTGSPTINTIYYTSNTVV